MKLAGYGEDRLVAELVGSLRHFRKEVAVGPGDDCAVIAERGAAWDQLLKTDAIVEGVHFLASAPAAKVGWKALCRAISDVAAMGGEARHALVTLGLPEEASLAWVRRLFSGIRQAGERYGVEIVGGETVRTPGPAFVSVALTGRVERGRAVLRSGGRAGDAVLVTGQLGGSIRGWHLEFHPRISEGRWLGKSGWVHAMMDLSDGLAADLPRLARASKVGWRLFDNVLPIRRGSTLPGALNDGEDYELLFTASVENLPNLLKGWQRNFPNLRLTVIGELIAELPPKKSPQGGYQHF